MDLGPLRLGFGCSGIWAERYFAERTAAALVHQAVAGGIRLFDTAPFYAGGAAIRRLGQAIRSIDADDILIASKTGTRARGRKRIKDFSPAGIRRDLDESLRQLGRERLDMLLLHGPDAGQTIQAAETLRELKAAGLIRATGICGDHQPATRAAIDSGAYDVLMCTYNILHRENADLIAAAKAKRMTVLAIAPLAQGLYRPGFFRPKSLPDLWYLARALARNRDDLRRARALKGLQQIPGWQPSELALAFTLANQDIDCAITTTTRPAHLAQNLAAATRELSSAEWRLLAS